jgi:hypothetical protein
MLREGGAEGNGGNLGAVRLSAGPGRTVSPIGNA